MGHYDYERNYEEVKETVTTEKDIKNLIKKIKENNYYPIQSFDDFTGLLNRKIANANKNIFITESSYYGVVTIGLTKEYLEKINLKKLVKKINEKNS